MVEKRKPDERINRLIKYMKDANDGLMDGTITENRRSCHTMLQRMARDFPKFDPEESVKRLIDAGKKQAFHGPNLTNFKYLVYHGIKIIQLSQKAKNGKANGPQQDDYAKSAAKALARKLTDRDS
jgi:hypothetical protein